MVASLHLLSPGVRHVLEQSADILATVDEAMHFETSPIGEVLIDDSTPWSRVSSRLRLTIEGLAQRVEALQKAVSGNAPWLQLPQTPQSSPAALLSGVRESLFLSQPGRFEIVPSPTVQEALENILKAIRENLAWLNQIHLEAEPLVVGTVRGHARYVAGVRNPLLGIRTLLQGQRWARGLFDLAFSMSLLLLASNPNAGDAFSPPSIARGIRARARR